MRRGIKRWIVLCALASGALLAATAAVVIGTWPYDRPVIALEPGGEDASFDGIRQLIAGASEHRTALHLVWVYQDGPGTSFGAVGRNEC